MKYIMLLLLLAVLVTGCTQTSSSEEDVIKIGFVSSLSGDAGIWGQSLQKGFDFAVDEYNSKDGNLPIKVVYEDDECGATTGISSFNKVITIDGVSYITGTVCSSVAMSVANVVDEERILYIASGATNPAVVHQSDMIFRLWPDDSYDAKAISEYAIMTLNLSTFYIAHLNDNPIGLAVKDSFERVVAHYNKTIYGSDDYSSDERDFRSTITKLIANNPDAVYVQTLPEQLPIFVNQLRNLGYNGVILLYGPSAASENILDGISNPTDLYYAVPRNVQQTSFWENYQTVTGEAPDALMALGYDSFKLLEKAIDSCGKDTICARDYILHLDEFESARGSFAFDEYGDVLEVPYEVVRVS